MTLQLSRVRFIDHFDIDIDKRYNTKSPIKCLTEKTLNPIDILTTLKQKFQRRMFLLSTQTNIMSFKTYAHIYYNP